MSEPLKKTASSLGEAISYALNYAHACTFWGVVKAQCIPLIERPSWYATRIAIKEGVVGEKFVRASGYYPSKMPMTDVWEAAKKGVLTSVYCNLITCWYFGDVINNTLNGTFMSLSTLGNTVGGLVGATATAATYLLTLQKAQRAALKRTNAIHYIKQTAINNPTAAP